MLTTNVDVCKLGEYMNGREMNITSSEWQVVRVIWTDGVHSSSDVFDVLSEKYGWTKSTVKTLLSRLVKKDVLRVKREGNRYLYEAMISKEEGTNGLAEEVMNKVCNREVKNVMLELINNTDFTSEDIDMLKESLDRKETVGQVKCDCLKGQCECNH